MKDEYERLFKNILEAMQKDKIAEGKSMTAFVHQHSGLYFYEEDKTKFYCDDEKKIVYKGLTFGFASDIYGIPDYYYVDNGYYRIIVKKASPIGRAIGYCLAHGLIVSLLTESASYEAMSVAVLSLFFKGEGQ